MTETLILPSIHVIALIVWGPLGYQCVYLGQNANGDTGNTSGRPCQWTVTMVTAATAQCNIVCGSLGQIRSVRKQCSQTVLTKTMRLEVDISLHFESFTWWTSYILAVDSDDNFFKEWVSKHVPTNAKNYLVPASQMRWFPAWKYFKVVSL